MGDIFCGFLFYSCFKGPLIKQKNIFRHKRLSTGANFVHVYIETWDKGRLKFNKFSMLQATKEKNNVIL